jgi:hypothetical protein
MRNIKTTKGGNRRDGLTDSCSFNGCTILFISGQLRSNIWVIKNQQHDANHFYNLTVRTSTSYQIQVAIELSGAADGALMNPKRLTRSIHNIKLP